MPSKLTKTELAVGELYYRQGLKPRDIAQKLGISINTVYKALSKYRAAMLRDSDGKEAAVNMPQDMGQITSGPLYSLTLSFSVNIADNSMPNLPQVDIGKVIDAVDRVYEEVKELKEAYDEIMRLLTDISNMLRHTNLNGSDGDNAVLSKLSENNTYDMDIPSFIKDNVWVDIIRSRHSGLTRKGY